MGRRAGAMQDSPEKNVNPDQLAVLAGILGEVLALANPPDDIARRGLSERLGRLLLQLVGAGITDREALKAEALKEIDTDPAV